MQQTEMDQKLKEKPQNKFARVQTDDPTLISLNGFTLLAREANIGQATRSLTIKADDKIPSSKLFKLKSPLHTRSQIYSVTHSLKH
jgi:hypothetical protein